jgi:hypothetical protein
MHAPVDEAAGDPRPPRPDAPVPGRYRRRLVAALIVLLAVPAVHGASWLPLAGGTSPARTQQAPPARSGAGGPSGASGGQVQTGDVPAPPAAAVQDLLDRRAAAVVAGDRAAWLSTVDPRVPGLAAAQGEVFDRLRVVEPTSWRYELLAADVPLSAAQRAGLPPDAVGARVRLTYRLGSAAPEIRREQDVALVRRTRWLVAAPDVGSLQRDPWDLGPVAVARGARSIVVALTDAPLPTRRTAAETDTAARRVDAVWGSDWPRTTVVFVPQDVEQMGSLLGRSSTAGLDQLAAVTTGERGGAGRTTGDRVVLNPLGFAELTATGRSAVLTHELTHVATRASARLTPPLWVDEGFADYVAYLGTSLRPRDLAADLLGSPRALAALRDLPSDGAFDPTAGEVGSAYAQAWLAMRMVAQQGGTARVVDFYRVATGLPPLRRWPEVPLPRAGLEPRTPLERACLQVLGYVQPSFVRRWIAYVRSQAAG